jgi:hypothetical protein
MHELTRRTALTASVATIATASPIALLPAAAASGQDAPLRALWARYQAAIPIENEKRQANRAARAAFDAAYPCPDGIDHCDHRRARNAEWAVAVTPAYDEWNDACRESASIIEQIQRTPAEGLIGIAIKLAALPSNIVCSDGDASAEPNGYDLRDAIKAALQAIAQLTGETFESEPLRVSWTPDQDDDDDEDAEPTYEEPTKPQFPHTEEEQLQWGARRTIAFLPADQSKARAIIEIVSEAVESQDFPALVRSAIREIF